MGTHVHSMQAGPRLHGTKGIAEVEPSGARCLTEERLATSNTRTTGRGFWLVKQLNRHQELLPTED